MRRVPCSGDSPSAEPLSCPLAKEPSWANDEVCPKCKVHHSCEGCSVQSFSEETSLALSAGTWCGPDREKKITASVTRKLTAFMQARPSVLHLDEIINKKDPQQVGHLLRQLIDLQIPVQVAFLQGAIPLQTEKIFPRLLEFLKICPVWSVNLGELRFSEEQCQKLAECLRKSGVTHMFYECTVAGSWKETYRAIIRENRQKHARWRLGPVCSQNRLVLAAVKNWYNPTAHDINKDWVRRNRGGYTNVERVQCEACRKWRRLPPGVTGWPREFYCQQGTWEPARARCDAKEEEWDRELPTTGDQIMYRVATGQWLQGCVGRVPPPRTRPTALPPAGGPRRGQFDDKPEVCDEWQPRQPRQRKQVERYEAASCTQYTRDLRQQQEKQDETRATMRMVTFTDGEVRNLLLIKPTKVDETTNKDNLHERFWLFARDWEEARVRLLLPEERGAARALEAGQRLFFKLDGKAWREVELSAPATPQQWAAVRPHLAAGGGGGGGGGGSGGGGGGAPARAGEAATSASGEAAEAWEGEGEGAEARVEEERRSWWQASLVEHEDGKHDKLAVRAEVRKPAGEHLLLLRFARDAQWELWCHNDAAEAGGAEAAAEEEGACGSRRGRGRGRADRGIR